jgi:hypothetical protein
MFFILREFFSSRIARRVGFAVLFFLFIFGGAFVRERGFSAFTEPAHFFGEYEFFLLFFL